ncbi:hypothetical protein ACET3Z_014689 [Daucus carota]
MEDPMPTLERLSNLIGLDLDTVYMGKKMVCNNDALPCLKYLILRNFHNLEEWLVEDGALSSLKNFESSGCNKLKKCPVKRVPFGSYVATVWYLQFREDLDFQVNMLRLLWIREEFISEADEELD